MNYIYILILVLISSSAFSDDGELKKKYEAIDRYNKTQSPAKMLDAYVESYTKDLPPPKAELFRDTILKERNLKLLTEDVKPIMAKHFTLEELVALAEFFESQHGASAMKKMGSFMAEFQPIFNAELMRLMKIWKEKEKE